MSYLEMALEVIEGKTVSEMALPKSNSQGGSLAPCGSPDCAGCYLVDAEAGAKIHPPKPSPKWLAWLERWETKGGLQ
jgi:hypothetical protein